MVKTGLNQVQTKKAKSVKSYLNAEAASIVSKCLPKKVFEISNVYATQTLIKSLALTAGSFWLLSTLPSVLIPIGWMITAITSLGLFAVGNDCAQHRFFSSNKINDIVGTLCFLPMLYPLASWQWHQNQGRVQASKARPLHRALIPLFWVLDAVRGVMKYYDLEKFDASDIVRARTSVSLVYLWSAVFFTLTAVYGGPLTITKYWLGPWLAFHFVKDLLLRQTPAISFDKKKHYVRLSFCSLVSPVEWLCNNVNFHIADSLALSVPSYRLSSARSALTSVPFAGRLEATSVGSVLSNMWNSSLSAINDRKKSPRSKAVPEQRDLDAVRTNKKTDRVEVVLRQKGLWHFLRHEVNWLHTPLLLGTPLIALYGFYTTPLVFKTAIFAVIWYFMTGIGITGGYHRLWAHRGYDAAWPVRLMLLCWASGAVEGSARWWCRDHRAHHRYTDTDKDPYSITNGFFYAHIGWMLLKQKPGQIGRADISDLNADAMLRNQHRHYLWWALFWGFVFPTLVAGLGWGDWWGGYFFAGVARLVFVHHATFCVNSLAHYVGSHTYADTHTPRDHFITALVTLGEGYHNFHHEFPQDYRNAIRWYQYDPTKLFIRSLAFFGLAYNLHRFPQNEIAKGAYQIAEKNLAKKRKLLDWGPAPSSLPVMSLDEVHRDDSARELIVIDGFVYDVREFAPAHPGGKIIDAFVGKDASKAFAGGVYAHSRAARNLLHTMLVGRLPDTPVEVPDVESKLTPTILPGCEESETEEEEESNDDDETHGLLAHISVARPQGEPITESAYEIDYAL